MKNHISPALANFDELPDSAHIRVKVVAAVFAVSVPTIWNWSKQGHLPKPVKLGPNVTAWRVGDLRARGAHQ